jgi:hypothetical protein
VAAPRNAAHNDNAKHKEQQDCKGSVFHAPVFCKPGASKKRPNALFSAACSCQMPQWLRGIARPRYRRTAGDSPIAPWVGRVPIKIKCGQKITAGRLNGKPKALPAAGAAWPEAIGSF